MEMWFKNIKIILFLAVLISLIAPAFALLNPAQVYCESLGFTYKMVDVPKGESSVCVFNNKTQCDAWAFLEGLCGKEYSYCVIIDK